MSLIDVYCGYCQAFRAVLGTTRRCRACSGALAELRPDGTISKRALKEEHQAEAPKLGMTRGEFDRAMTEVAASRQRRDRE